MEKDQLWNQIVEKREELVTLTGSYWWQFSNLGTWQFWGIAGMLVLPLVVLFLFVDRRRILELFFFGFAVHMLWSYTDVALDRGAIFVHKHFLLPFFPFGINLSASAIPAAYILIYQFCIHKRKSFLLFSLIISAFLAFGLAPLERLLGLVDLRRGFNFFYLFFIDVAVSYTAYGMAKLVLALQRTDKKERHDEEDVDRIRFESSFFKRSKVRN